MKLPRLFVLLIAWMSAFTAQAAPAVTGDVSFDQASGLYTYSYVLDTSELPPGGFHQFAVLSNKYPTHSAPRWISHTAPEGWNLVLSVGGWSQPGIQVYGSFWAWESITPETDPDKLLSFSFTTSHAPDTSTANNYFIYSGPNAGPDNLPVDFGRIVGPDLAFPVPEPTTVLMWMAGLAVLAWTQRTRAR